MNEVQALRCIGDGGTLQLEFGHVFGVGVVSSDISATATASELKAALQARAAVPACQGSPNTALFPASVDARGRHRVGVSGQRDGWERS